MKYTELNKIAESFFRTSDTSKVQNMETIFAVIYNCSLETGTRFTQI